MARNSSRSRAIFWNCRSRPGDSPPGSDFLILRLVMFCSSSHCSIVGRLAGVPRRAASSARPAELRSVHRTSGSSGSPRRGDPESNTSCPPGRVRLRFWFASAAAAATLASRSGIVFTQIVQFPQTAADGMRRTARQPGNISHAAMRRRMAGWNTGCLAQVFCLSKIQPCCEATSA